MYHTISTALLFYISDTREQTCTGKRGRRLTVRRGQSGMEVTTPAVTNGLIPPPREKLVRAIAAGHPSPLACSSRKRLGIKPCPLGRHMDPIAVALITIGLDSFWPLNASSTAAVNSSGFGFFLRITERSHLQYHMHVHLMHVCKSRLSHVLLVYCRGTRMLAKVHPQR